MVELGFKGCRGAPFGPPVFLRGISEVLAVISLWKVRHLYYYKRPAAVAVILAQMQEAFVGSVSYGFQC